MGSSITVSAILDDIEQTQSKVQNYQVIVNDSENSAPIVPQHLMGETLYSSAQKGDVEAVKLFLDAKHEVNMQGWFFYGNALQVASKKGHEIVVRLLLDKGADVNAQGGHCGNALQAASLSGHDMVV